MARKRETKNRTETIFPIEIPVSDDLTARLQKISKQTGLSPLNLFQKWILQEESLIGLMRQVQGGKERIAERKEIPAKISRQPIPGSQKRKEARQGESPDRPNYRKTLVKRAAKLKKEGMTLVKIAEVFNAENVQTVSGKGKWYSSSIANLLKPMD
jgi:hypothetical protein